jgi:hypothetical protein
MTQFTDFDRVLGDWLAEGPTRAPEHPVEMAVEHARSHPRRWDPLAAVRRDPMAGSAGGSFGIVGRPALVLASVGLLLAAIAAGALIGSQREDPVVVPPITSASPSPSTSPSAGPSVSPIGFTVDFGDGRTADVVDETGRLTSVAAGEPRTEQTGREIEVFAVDASTIRLVWTGGPCDRIHRLTVTAAALDLERPTCAGDSIPFEFAVDLFFDGPVDPSAFSTSIETGQGNGLPNATVTGPDAAGNPFFVSAFDASEGLIGLESFSEGSGGASVEPGTVAIANEAPDRLRILWASGPCHDTVRVSISADLSTIEIDEVECTGDAVAFDRLLVLTFDRAVDATTVNGAYREGPAG